MIKSDKLESGAAFNAAQAMAAAARTAPKTRGIDNIEIVLLDDSGAKTKLADKMLDISKKEDRPSMERDSHSISSSHLILALGVRSNPAGLNCGFCGYKTCQLLTESGGICAYNSIDLGISAGSACSTASDWRMDNRIMYSIGRACLDLGLFSKDVKQALGIPLSISGKNPFFDRK